MLFKFKKNVGCIEPWFRNLDTNRNVSWCIVTALTMTPPHVVRLGSTAEPEKVNPLVPRQQGDGLLCLQPSEWCLYKPGCLASDFVLH